MHFPTTRKGGTVTRFAPRKIRTLFAGAAVLGLLVPVASVSPVAAADRVKTTSVTFKFTTTYTVSSKGASEPKTVGYVQYANGRKKAGFWTETAQILDDGTAFGDYRTVDTRKVKAGKRSDQIRVVSYRGQDLPGSQGAFALEAVVGNIGLAALDWTNTDQPGASYFAAETPKGIKLKVTITSTCTVNFPFKGSEPCSKRTESVDITNKGNNKVKLAFCSEIIDQYSAWQQNLSVRTKKLKPGKIWHINFMSHKSGGTYYYFGRSWPGYWDRAFSVMVGNFTVAGAYYDDTLVLPPWWERVLVYDE